MKDIVTKNGRVINRPDNLKYGSDRVLSNTLKKINRWLYEESLKEIEQYGNDYLRTLHKAINIENLSQSDVDFFHEILFNGESIWLDIKNETK